MFRIPNYFIIVFVGLSILTAYGIHRFQSSRGSHSQFSTTRTPQSQVSLDESSQELLSMTRNAEPSCMCLRNSSIDSTDIQPEEISTCTKDRRYLNEILDSTPALYRESRVRRPSEFPRECLIYVMKHWQREAEKTPSASFSRCDQSQGKNSVLDSSNPKPCVSENYVNVVYNYFSDVTDCFGLPQRDWIPRLYQGSGFHLSAQSDKDGVGLGQLTTPSVLQANKSFELYQSLVNESNRPSCQRLKSSILKLKPVDGTSKDSCSRLASLQDPLTNLFYTTIVELQNRQQLQMYLSKSKIDIFAKMAKLGLTRNSFDEERLVDILALLASDTGAGSAVILLNNYLGAFSSFSKRSLKSADFAVEGSEDKVPSFFEYVKTNQISGHPGYLNAVYEKAKDLSQQFKEGACVPESFLSL